MRDRKDDELSNALEIRSIAQHHHWHDAESLFLVCSRFQRSLSVKQCIDAWLSQPGNATRTSWLDQVTTLWQSLGDLKPCSDRERAEVGAVAKLLQAGVLAFKDTARTDDLIGIDLARCLFAGGPDQDVQLFTQLLAACNTAISGLNEIDGTPDVHRLGNSSIPRGQRTRVLSETLSSRAPDDEAGRTRPSPNKRSKSDTHTGVNSTSMSTSVIKSLLSLSPVVF